MYETFVVSSCFGMAEHVHSFFCFVYEKVNMRVKYEHRHIFSSYKLSNVINILFSQVSHMVNEFIRALYIKIFRNSK